MLYNGLELHADWVEDAGWPRCQLFYPIKVQRTIQRHLLRRIYIDRLISSWNGVIRSRTLKGIPIAKLGGLTEVYQWWNHMVNGWFDCISLGPHAFVAGVKPPWEGLGVLLLSNNSRALTSLDVIWAITENESYNPWERGDVGGTTYVYIKLLSGV